MSARAAGKKSRNCCFKKHWRRWRNAQVAFAKSLPLRRKHGKPCGERHAMKDQYDAETPSVFEVELKLPH